MEATCAHKYRLAALKCMPGPPLDAFMPVSQRVNKEGFEVNPLLLDMLRTKQYKGDDMEDPYAHIDFFEDIRGTFRLNAFTDEEEMKLKLFKYTLSDKSLSWFKSHPT